MLKPIMRRGYKIFGRYVHRYRDRLAPLSEKLRIARLPYTVEEYVSGALLLTVLAFFVSFSVAFFMFYRLYTYPVIVAIAVSFLISVSLAGLAWLSIMGYPSYVVEQRKDEIDSRLSYAVTHMSTLAGTGIPAIAIFRALTRFKEYGEISRECAYIVRDVEVFGKDIYTAISDAARYSPSKLWSEVLWGLVSTLRSGGDLRAYLSEKAHALVEMHEREEKKAIETLNVITEIFMVVFVLAPVVGVIMIVFISMLGGRILGLDARMFLLFIIYFILPVIGILFILLGESSKPKEVL